MEWVENHYIDFSGVQRRVIRSVERRSEDSKPVWNILETGTEKPEFQLVECQSGKPVVWHPEVYTSVTDAQQSVDSSKIHCII